MIQESRNLFVEMIVAISFETAVILEEGAAMRAL